MLAGDGWRSNGFGGQVVVFGNVDGIDIYKRRDSAVCYALHGGNAVENYLANSAHCWMTAFCRSVAFFITST